jgi:hypothetical protein
LVRYGCVSKKTLLKLAKTLPLDDQMKAIILQRINSDFAAHFQVSQTVKHCANRRRFPRFNRMGIMRR